MTASILVEMATCKCSNIFGDKMYLFQLRICLGFLLFPQGLPSTLLPTEQSVLSTDFPSAAILFLFPDQKRC